MSHIVLLLAGLYGLACASLALISFVLLCGTAWDHAIEHHRKSGQQRCEATTQTLKEDLNNLSAGVQAVQHGPPGGTAPGARPPALSLARRTQALRMHRRGSSPEQIAEALDIPLGEVDLLVKVHRIVISNI